MTKTGRNLVGLLFVISVLGGLAGCGETPRVANPAPVSTIAATATPNLTEAVAPALGQPVKLAPGECCVTALAVSPDGKTLALVIKSQVRLWSFEAARLEATFEMPAKAALDLTGLSWSADGQRLAAGTTTGMVLVWNSGGKLLAAISAHTQAVRAVAFAPHDKLLASAGTDGAVKVWQGDYQLLSTLAGDGQPLTALAWSPDGSQLALAEAGTNKIWLKLINGRTRQVWSDPGGGVTALSWASTTGRLATSSNDHHLRIWTTEGALVSDQSGPVNTLAWSSDGRLVAVGGSDHHLGFWSMVGKSLGGPATTTEAELQAVAWLPGDQTLVTVDRTGILLWWK